jgi:5-methylcytosine-specific restriction endonuclease McrA
VTEKPCIDCGEVKPLSEFYRHPRMSDGHLNSCKDCRRTYQRSRPYDKERERRRNQTEARKKYHAANLKRWRRENPLKAAAQRDRIRSLRLRCDGNYTAAEFRAHCEKYGNVCLRCGRGEVPLTPDHVVPLSLGGSNWISNIQPLCRRCNSWKNARVMDYRPEVVTLNTPVLS